MKKYLKLIRCITLLFIMVQVTAVSVFAASTIKAPEIYAVQSANKKVTVSWNKVKNADGYSVEYKTTGGKWIAKKTTKKSVVISGLKNGKKYAFRVRAYKTTDGKKAYGPYSTKVKIKVEKQVVPQSSGYYCKVCGYGKGRNYNYSFWTVFGHIASKHPQDVLKRMWSYRYTAAAAITFFLSL